MNWRLWRVDKYKIKILPLAQDDMKSILYHIRQDDPQAAVRMVAAVREAISRLSEFPLMGSVPQDKKIADQGYRKLIVRPYLVFYIVVSDENIVKVHRVLHQRRNHLTLL